MNDLQTYESRAAQARSEAEEAKLDNVRDRCLRAADAWEQMAERVRRTDQFRATLAADKARAAGLAE
ncbi:hypothetical protein [Sphingomonas sinipercae]|uniref:hypothetical protein n=1 Tax=Sphingomonas sinipercae TaxID=2714944 RepID=UPI001FE69AAA|nr:hypothetical protein [Sphingomonas sinipercae]